MPAGQGHQAAGSSGLAQAATQDQPPATSHHDILPDCLPIASYARRAKTCPPHGPIAATKLSFGEGQALAEPHQGLAAASVHLHSKHHPLEVLRDDRRACISEPV